MSPSWHWSPADAGELSWLAFRYVSGELPAEEAAAFEERLLADESACEAVAQLVELSQAVRLAESAVAALPAGAIATGGRRLALPRIFQVGLAVALVGAIGLGVLLSRRGSEAPGERATAARDAGPSGVVAGELISRWRSSGDPTVTSDEASADDWGADGDDADDHALLGSFAERELGDSSHDDDREVARGSGGISIPAWMLAAVTAAHADALPGPEGENHP